MSRKRKTPAPLAEVIMHRQPEVVSHAEELLRVKRTVPVENQAEHVRSRSEQEIAAFVDGYNACLEEVMHRFGCYAGFNHYGRARPCEPVDLSVPESQRPTHRQTVSRDHPDYLEWRKLYYTNGVAKS